MVTKHIPNTLTSLNLVFGCFSILYSLNGELEPASWCIGIAAVIDYFDGFVARALKAGSPMGKELDSLADMVSFGAAPGFIFYMLTAEVFPVGPMSYHTWIVMLLPVFSALRLAKFNIDTRQSDSFIGVPTPANAMFIASIPLIIAHDSWGLAGIFENPVFLIAYPFVMSYLMISEIPLLALKFKNFSFDGNRMRYLLIGCAAASIAIFGYAGVALAIVLYILLSVINNFSARAGNTSPNI